MYHQVQMPGLTTVTFYRGKSHKNICCYCTEIDIQCFRRNRRGNYQNPGKPKLRKAGRATTVTNTAEYNTTSTNLQAATLSDHRRIKPESKSQNLWTCDNETYTSNAQKVLKEFRRETEKMIIIIKQQHIKICRMWQAQCWEGNLSN